MSDPEGAALLASDPDSAAPLLARYRRGSGGKTVHRAECTTLRGRGTPWPYADGKTADQIVQAMASAPWLYACKVCRPDRDGEQA